MAGTHDKERGWPLGAESIPLAGNRVLSPTTARNGIHPATQNEEKWMHPRASRRERSPVNTLIAACETLDRGLT